MLVALGPSRSRITLGTSRVRVALRSSTMSIANRLTPPQDAGVEAEIIGFDSGLTLASNETIVHVSGVTCTVDVGTDPSPSSRLSGGNTIMASARTGAANAMVLTLFSGALAGTTYQLQCLAVTSLGQTLSIVTYISGEMPP